MPASVSTMMDATITRMAGLLSAGTMYQGATAVLVAAKAAS